MSNNPPTDVIRDGNLRASIWRNVGEQGPFYAVNLTRTYTDDKGEARDSHSFAGTDLLRLSELARSAYGRTRDLQREDRVEQPRLLDNTKDSDREKFAAKRRSREAPPQERSR